ncbi:Glycerol-3-phosphate dehydrogenase [NAD(P)+] [compost metagenome]
MLGQGKPLATVLEEMGMVVEGVKTTRAAYEMSKQYQVRMPITQVLYQVLFEGKEPKRGVEDLMGRVRTHEIEEIAQEAAGKWLG